jgi:hypothetical protein
MQGLYLRFQTKSFNKINQRDRENKGKNKREHNTNVGFFPLLGQSSRHLGIIPLLKSGLARAQRRVRLIMRESLGVKEKEESEC